jgi:hypothetical protein
VTSPFRFRDWPKIPGALPDFAGGVPYVDPTTGQLTPIIGRIPGEPIIWDGAKPLFGGAFNGGSRPRMEYSVGGNGSGGVVHVSGWTAPDFFGTWTGTSADDTAVAPYAKVETDGGGKGGFKTPNTDGGATRTAWLPDVEMRFRPGASITDQTLWLGLVNLGAIGSGADPGGTYNLLMFRRVAGTDTNFMAVARRNDSPVSIRADDTGVAVAAEADMKARIRVLSPGPTSSGGPQVFGLVQYWINDVLVATLDEGIPFQTEALFPAMYIYKNTGTNKHFWFSDFLLSRR